MDPKELPIDGTLDLHTFRPDELGSLIPNFISECLKKEIYEIRIIHGKGTGNLRRSVHALLDRNPNVQTYSLANDRSGWGATIASLKRKQPAN
ncbi:Smr/MutS family protein [Fodinibius saliphilus]|uniref:Smr/MutS family protein n=1 Tax=Fodinibius saliphilus TaxID=1920650 RepID=UPI0011088EB5|nr:Smr/MutS family protein [Fodinibius saliphilus]